MVSTSIDIDPDRRDQVREVVFSDLTSSQIKHYAAEIEEIEAIEELERQLECHRSAKTKKPRRSQEVLDRTQKVREIQLRRKICPQEAECIMKQEEILDAVVDTIDLVPNPSFAARKMRCSKVKLCGRAWSVLKPGHLAQDDHEVLVPRECHIDRDCDQVRAMIKILVRRGHWTMEDFTKALDGSGRPEVNQFLEKRGPLQGKQSAVFQRSWDFFKKRELLGLELTAPPPKPKLAREIRALRGLQEVNPNRGYKRPSVESSEKPAKLQKR
jgi:hypothetical protein